MLDNISMLKEIQPRQKNYLVQCEGTEVCIRINRDYTKTHMWIKNSFDGNHRVGITDYAQKHLKEKVGLVEIFRNTTVGTDVEAGEVFVTIYERPCANLD